jgi:hypothetical protein
LEKFEVIDMRKFISLLVSVMVICASLCACQVQKTDEDHVVMAAKHINYGENSVEEDYWVSTTYVLNTNGTLEYVESYNVSGQRKSIVQVEQSTVDKIIAILKSQRFARDNDNVGDGSAWDITYYGPNDKVISDYKGYIDDNKKYKELSEILRELTENVDVGNAPADDEAKGTLLTLSTTYIATNMETMDDTWVSREWVVRYDKTVCYKLKSGDADEALEMTTVIESDALEKICQLMDMQVDTESNNQILDAMGVSIDYYDKNGNKIKSFSGHINEYNNLTELYTLLDSIVS